MKRSEVINLIAEFLQNDDLNPNHCSFESKANSILKLLEENRMEPPKTWGSIPTIEAKEVDQENKIVHFVTGESWGLINKWEPEDEQT